MKKKEILQPKVFNLTSDQCVWAKAGVIGPTACINAFNCLDCPVDRKMQIRVKQKQLAQGPGRGMSPELKETLQRTPKDRSCRHMLSGRVVSKVCPYDFDCTSCSFQQMMEDEAVNAQAGPIQVEPVAGFQLAKKYYYHPSHVWARVEYGGRVRIGLDDFSARLFGTLDRIKLPALGTRLEKEKNGISVSRGRFALNLNTPVQGVVVARNPAILKDTSPVNQSPYNDGWLMVLEPLRLRADLKKLLFGEKTLAWMELESSRLAEMLTPETEYQMAATGGRAVADIFGRLPETAWEETAKVFLQTG